MVPPSWVLDAVVNYSIPAFLKKRSSTLQLHSSRPEDIGGNHDSRLTAHDIKDQRQAVGDDVAIGGIIGIKIIRNEDDLSKKGSTLGPEVGTDDTLQEYDMEDAYIIPEHVSGLMTR